MGGALEGTAFQDQFAIKTFTFTGSSAEGQAGTAVPIFTVTGEVLITYFAAFCTADLAESGGTAQISLGVVGNVTLFVTTGQPIDIDVNKYWTTNNPTAAGGVAVPAAFKDILLIDGADIIADPTVADTNGGTIEFTIFWRPLSSDGLVVAA